MDMIWYWIILIVGGVLIANNFVKILSLGKKKKLFGLIGAGLVIFSLFAGFGATSWLGKTFTAVQTEGEEQIGACSYDGTTLTVLTKEEYNPSTTDTDGYAYAVNGIPLGHAVSGTTISVTPGDKVTILAGNSSTTATSWYGAIADYTVPCKATDTLLVKAYDMSASSPLTFTNIDDDGVTKLSNDGGANNISTSAGAVESYELEIKGTYEDSFGLNNVALCFEYNTTMVDSFELSGGAKIAKPSHLTTATGFTEDCWEFPAIRSSDKLSTTISVDYDDTLSPVASKLAWTLTVVDDDAYENDLGEYVTGYFDADATNTGLGQTDQTNSIYFSA